MRRLLALALAIGFAAVCMNTADAQRRGGGGRMGGMRPMSRPSMPVSRPSTPVQRPSAPSGGFNFNNDIGGGRPSQLPSNGIQRPGGGIDRPPGTGQRPPGDIGSRPPGSIGSRPPVPPNRPPLPSWGWNGGVAWYPVPTYWGGGFWGPWGYGFTTGVFFGTYYDEETKEEQKSYEVAADSPGAKVLEAYGLTQAQCGANNLVVIRGPNNSVVCAQPNSTVSAGEYDLDVSNLTIVSAQGASS